MAALGTGGSDAVRVALKLDELLDATNVEMESSETAVGHLVPDSYYTARGSEANRPVAEPLPGRAVQSRTEQVTVIVDTSVRSRNRRVRTVEEISRCCVPVVSDYPTSHDQSARGFRLGVRRDEIEVSWPTATRFIPG